MKNQAHQVVVPSRFDRVQEPVPVTHEGLMAFVALAQSVIDEHMTTKFPTLPRVILSVEPGRKYARIVRADGGSSRSVYCFVDLTNGNVLKAATWKAPAKHARGSVHDLEAAKGWLTPYGCAYLA